jgi:hypothetical protein
LNRIFPGENAKNRDFSGMKKGKPPPLTFPELTKARRGGKRHDVHAFFTIEC